MASATNRQRIEAEYIAAHVRALTLLENLHQRIEDTPAPSDDGPAIGWGRWIANIANNSKNHFSPDDADVPEPLRADAAVCRSEIILELANA